MACCFNLPACYAPSHVQVRVYEMMEPLHQTRVHLEDTVKEVTSQLADKEQEMMALNEVHVTGVSSGIVRS